MGILADALPLSDVQFSPEMGPEASEAKLPEMIIDRLPRRQISWQKPPGTPHTQEVKERVKDATERVAAESSLRRSGRQEWLQT